VRQVGYLRELNRDAQSTEHNVWGFPIDWKKNKWIAANDKIIIIVN